MVIFLKRLLTVVSAAVFFICVFTLLFFIVYKTDSSVSTLSDTVNKTPSVVIDVGHGGEDGGAVAPDGTVEKDLNLSVALKLRDILNLYGVNIIMTRTEDISIYSESAKDIRHKKISDIHNRFKIMQDNPDALFVSVHQNKFSSPAQFGTQVFYSKNTASSKRLAECIQKSVVKALQPENKRVVKPSGSEIYLLYNAKTTAVLVECGFISNKNELEKLKNDSYQTQMAICIADGIINYLQNG